MVQSPPDLSGSIRKSNDIAISGLSNPEYAVILIILMHTSAFLFLIVRKVRIVFAILSLLILFAILVHLYTFYFNYNELLISGRYMMFIKRKKRYRLFDINDLTCIHDSGRGYYSFTFKNREEITAYLSMGQAEARKIADHLRIICGNPGRYIKYSSSFGRTTDI